MKNHLRKTFNLICVCVFSPLFLNAQNLSKEPICKSIEECDKLSNSLEKQIEDIEEKTNLTKEDKKTRYKKQLVAVQRVKWWS